MPFQHPLPLQRQSASATSNDIFQVQLVNSPLEKGVRGILSPHNAGTDDEIPPTPIAKGGGLFPDIEDWKQH